MNRATKRFVFYQIIPSIIAIYIGVKILNYGLSTGEATGSFAGLFFMMGTIVFVAIINSGMIARFIGKITMPLFYPSEHNDRPTPIYSIPRAKRKMREYDAAILEYEKIISEYPEEHQPYLEMMEIAMVDLHSHEKLDAIYERGMNAIKDAEHRDNLTRYYGVLQRWNSKPNQ